MKRKNLKYIALPAFIILLVVCFFAVDLLVPKWLERRQQAREVPSSGEYWNAELDITLCFSDDGVSMRRPNGKSEPINIHPAGRFVTQDGSFNAWYKWHGSSGELTLTIISHWDSSFVDNEYTFLPLPSSPN